jgi:hypothetical protein
MYRVVWPGVALLLAMSTMLRGTVLTYAVTLIFAATQRRLHEQSGRREPGRPRDRLRSMPVVGVASILSLYVYGLVRDRFRAEVGGNPVPTTQLQMPTVLTAGSGLLAISQIITQYGSPVEHFWGKTYSEMALLPIPRALY